MKTAAIIPDRGDRPEFLKNCYRMLNAQTVKPDIIATVNYAPLSNEVDITQRYRTGYSQFNNSDFDVIFFIENDDWYSPLYIETMLAEWQRAGNPDLCGINISTYYHIGINKYFHMTHSIRACAMNTMIKPNLNINWCADNDPYLDLHLWLKNDHLSKHLFSPEKKISLGIKHGIGLGGGHHHNTRMERYVIDDNGKQYLQTVLDLKSFYFYTSIFQSK